MVFLPRNIAMNIDATVESGGPGRIEADPSLPLNIQSQPNGPVHVMASLNGGGALLKLHTTAGKIQLQYLDAQAALRQSLQEEEKQRLAERFSEYQATSGFDDFARRPRGTRLRSYQPNDLRDDWFDSAKKRFEVIFMGSIREDNKDFTKRLTLAPPPEYPASGGKRGSARQGGAASSCEGGRIGETWRKCWKANPHWWTQQRPRSRRWRAKPEQINGKNVEVVSTVSFEFQLRH